MATPIAQGLQGLQGGVQGIASTLRTIMTRLDYWVLLRLLPFWFRIENIHTA